MKYETRKFCTVVYTRLFFATISVKLGFRKMLQSQFRAAQFRDISQFRQKNSQFCQIFLSLWIKVAKMTENVNKSEFLVWKCIKHIKIA